jgi:hypothetical protein
MSRVNFFILPQIAVLAYLVGAGGEILNLGDGMKKIFLVVSILISGILRFLTLRAMFRRGGVGKGMAWTEIVFSILSHLLFFSSLFILFRTDYIVPNPTNSVTDSLYFTTDILATVGTSDIRPLTALTKTIDTVHYLDTYLLLLLIGYEIVFALRGIELNATNGSPGKA